MEEISIMTLKTLYPPNMTEGFVKFVSGLKNKDSSLTEILDELFCRFFFYIRRSDHIRKTETLCFIESLCLFQI